jgi:excisionase family DNA binding protein
MAKWLTTKQVAEELFVSVRRVQALIKSGRFPSALKRGRDWYIKDTDLFDLYDRKPGRPSTS